MKSIGGDLTDKERDVIPCYNSMARGNSITSFLITYEISTVSELIIYQVKPQNKRE